MNTNNEYPPNNNSLLLLTTFVNVRTIKIHRRFWYIDIKSCAGCLKTHKYLIYQQVTSKQASVFDCLCGSEMGFEMGIASRGIPKVLNNTLDRKKKKKRSPFTKKINAFKMITQFVEMNESH